jgi:hypothetical protein
MGGVVHSGLATGSQKAKSYSWMVLFELDRSMVSSWPEYTSNSPERASPFANELTSSSSMCGGGFFGGLGGGDGRGASWPKSLRLSVGTKST